MKPQSVAAADKPLSQLAEELSAIAGIAVDELEELQHRAHELGQRVQHLRAMVGLIERRLERDRGK